MNITGNCSLEQKRLVTSAERKNRYNKAMLMSWTKYLLAKGQFMLWAPTAVKVSYAVSVIILSYSLYLGLFIAPADQVQGEVFRIIYVHVPMAALSLALYAALALMCALFWIFHIKMADHAAVACAGVGLTITTLALATGSIWGKPTWGVWWIWDARLTSEALLWLLFVGYLSLRFSLHPIVYAKKIAAIVGFIGIFDVPLIHYSVQWWYTLHQGSSILHFAKPTIAWSMLFPLLWSIAGFSLLVLAMVLHTVIVCILAERHSCVSTSTTKTIHIKDF